MINNLLKAHLDAVVHRRRRLQLWRKLAACWGAAALLGLILFGLERLGGWTSSLALPFVALTGLVAALVVAARNGRGEPDWHAVALEIEANHPELDGRLLTAVQQEPTDGELNYLQERLVIEAALHSQQGDWAAIVPPSRFALAHLAHLAALAFLLVVLSQLHVPGSHALFTRAPASGITVTPGDTSLERGSSLVVLARFIGPLPPDVELIVGASPENSRRLPLVKSLADPVFGGSVPEVASNLTYHVEYAGQRTPDFKVTVFEYPRLERSDADVTFPAYTGQEPKRIENTRRVSAVEGSHLGLTLQFNKPVTSARLVAKNDAQTVVPLQIETNQPRALLSGFPLETSRTYELQLVDGEGRTNKVRSQFVFAVLTNRGPELKMASPRGDTRPSPLEEVLFEGTVWDDFGVRDYGLAYTLVGQETKFIELGQAVPAKEKRTFQHVLRLEDLGVQPDQLISWYAWADDVGPDGQVRRTAGDMFFAEVRPFEEVFREGQGMDGQQNQSGEQQGQQGGGSPAGRLADLQKQIINATWKLQRQQGGAKPTPAKPADAPKSPSKQSSSGATDRSRSAGFQPAVSPILNRQGLAIAAAPAGLKPAIQQIENLRYAARSLPQFAGQLAPGSGGVQRGSRGRGQHTAVSNAAPVVSTGVYAEDAVVVRDAQSQALDQAQTAQQNQQDPRASAMWDAAVKRMEQALENLKTAADSPAVLPQALLEEQAAYQALLKLQEHEYQVSRSRNRSQGGNANSSREQQMQMQLDQMDLAQSENRYETQRQAQSPQSPERREQLQVMNRLQELARRQQDLNDRLREMQTALQEARTEAEREDIRRRLKRLQEEEQQMLADVDELRQRMDQPENQSRMSEERQQLEQTRQDVQRAAEAASQGTPSQALASGTRAQRQLQDLRDQMRRENSSQFADDLRDMRAEARELARRQEDLVNRMDQRENSEHKSLSDSGERPAMLEQLARQRERLTNIVERATQVSQDAETSEPLISRQLYDTVRKFTQDTGRDLKDLQDKLLRSGLLTSRLNDQLQQPSESDGAKLMDISSEMLRLDVMPPAQESAGRARDSINDLARGVERAAESVLGDDTESLRLAQQQLDQLTEQLAREIAQAQGGGTNRTAGSPASGARRGSRPGGTNAVETARGGGTNGVETAQAGAQRGSGQRSQNEANGEAQDSDQASANDQQQRSGQQPGQANGQGRRGAGQQSAQAGGQRGQRSGGENEAQANQPEQDAQAQDNQEMASDQNAGQNTGGQSGQAGQAGGARGGQRGGQRGEDQQTAQNGQGQQDQAQGQGQDGNRSGNRAARGGNRGGNRLGGARNDGGRGGGVLDRVLDTGGEYWTGGPITGEDFVRWSDELRNVEEMIEIPELRNDVATARERARALRQDFKRDGKKPDWAVVRLQIEKPLVEVRERIADELARRGSQEALVPIDRDPVPNRYSELVRRYYEELGKDK